jgi:hypothetical protein
MLRTGAPLSIPPRLAPSHAAPARDTLYASRMARDLLWVEEGSLRLEDFVDVSQT